VVASSAAAAFEEARRAAVAALAKALHEPACALPLRELAYGGDSKAAAMAAAGGGGGKGMPMPTPMSPSRAAAAAAAGGDGGDSASLPLSFVLSEEDYAYAEVNDPFAHAFVARVHGSSARSLLPGAFS